jgi:hypothetical protein
MNGRRENVQDWLAVDAGAREPLSGTNSLVNREKYREFDLLAVFARR